MAIPWPTSLQQKLNEAAFGYSIGSTAIRSDMGYGPAKVRRRTTRSIDTLTCSINIDISEYQTIYDFFDIDLNGGVNIFELVHPITGVLTNFRFVDPPSFRPNGGRNFLVNMNWEVL